MKANEFFRPDEKYFIGKKRITGIYQTGRRLFIKKNVSEGDELILKREYGNRYDERAVAVYDVYGNRIGYIEAKSNDDVAFFLDSGFECIATVTDVDRNSATVGILTDAYCKTDAVSMERLKASYEEYLKDIVFKEESKS
ncbi:MAG: HIRAN domain-containing protein [Clostridia bacterium]|nr:HIRAN domain-containing protein [Clostridia bacterium]